MRLNIGSLVGRKGAFFQVERKVASDFVRSSPEISQAVEPIKVKLKVTNTGEGYLVTGDLTLEVKLRCSRCLKPLQTKLEASIEEEFLNQRPREQDEESLWDEEPLVEGNELDLTSLIEESILMSIPMKAVCRQDCPGLCPTCGTDLTEETCDCLSPEIDIRLAALSKLLETPETSKSKIKSSAERRKDHGSTKEKTLKSKD